MDAGRRREADLIPPSGTRPRIRVIVVTHNSAGDIAACLRSISSAKADLDIVLADNASTDHTVDLVRGEAPSIALHVNAENLGFGRAVNLLGRDLAGIDYLLLVNPDAVLEPRTIDALMDFARQMPGAGLYGGRMLDGAGRLNPISCLAAPNLRHALAFGLGLSLIAPWADPDSLGGWRRTGQREVPVLTAGLLLIEPALWLALGGFDEQFFMYGEDVDLCLRARQLGARPMFTESAVYVHKDGSSSTTNADRQMLLLRGKASLYRRWLPPGRGRIARALLISGVGLRAALERFARPDDRTWRTAWRRRASWRQGWDTAPGGGDRTLV